MGLLLGTSVWYALYGTTLESESAFEDRMDALARELGSRGRADAVVAAAAGQRQSSDVAAPCTQEEALPPEPAPEPDATALASPPSRSQSSPAVLDWSVAELRTWLAEAMQQPAVADAAAEEEVDGATALVMGKEEWKELGVSGIKAAKIVAQLTKLAK